jgi:subtilisin inhibitor-like
MIKDAQATFTQRVCVITNMKPLLTRAFTRNALAATIVAASSLGLAGLVAGPAFAHTGATAPASLTANHTAALATAFGPPVHGGPEPGGPGPGGPGFNWQWPHGPGPIGYGQPTPRWPQGELWIIVRATQSAPLMHWNLTCGPTGGTLPNAPMACAQLSHTFQPFAALPRSEMCPMIYYGPETASITGYWYGAWVSIQLGRSNGCQESKWNKVIAALGLGNLPGEVNPGGPMRGGPPPPTPLGAN